jgi:hypothetical protein
MAYQDALGLPVPAIDRCQIGRRCVFAVNDLRGWREHSRSLWSFMATWLRCDSAPFHWNDPAPALHYLRQTMAAFFESELRLGITKEDKTWTQSQARETVATHLADSASLAK